MKFDSPLFDRIRVKPDLDRRPRTALPSCNWPGCAHEATHRAPKGRAQEREYWRFCLDHVREYNHSYNFFAGMSDDAVARFQKDAITGHRPTWKMGMLGGKSAGKSSSSRFFNEAHGTADDPFEMYRELGAKPRRGNGQGHAAPVARTGSRTDFPNAGPLVRWSQTPTLLPPGQGDTADTRFQSEPESSTNSQYPNPSTASWCRR